MQTMEERPADTKIDRLEERMNERFDHLAGLFLAYAGFQLS